MSLNIEANTWAPKLIIAFQLTVWSAVGIMLLQRGAMSLCSKAEARNHTDQIQGRFTRWNGKTLSIAESRLRMVNEKRDARIDDPEDDIPNREQRPRTRIDDIPGIESVIRKRTTIGREEETRDPRRIRGQTVRANTTDNQQVIDRIKGDRTNDRNANKPVNKDNVSSTFLEYQRSNDFIDFHTSDKEHFFERENGHDSLESKANETRDDRDDRDETKSRRSPVNRIGAVAAILMLAVGVLMLLLGPLIIIVRAIGHRRRTREMSVKSRCRNDQPPTYEEATLMDQVPRYSSLQLDTILHSSFSSV